MSINSVLSDIFPKDVNELIQEYYSSFRIRKGKLTCLLQKADEKDDWVKDRCLSFNIISGLWTVSLSPLTFTPEGIFNAFILYHSNVDISLLPPLNLDIDKMWEMMRGGKITNSIKLCFDNNTLDINILIENTIGSGHICIFKDVYGIGSPANVLIFLCKYETSRSDIIRKAMSQVVLDSGRIEDNLRKLFPGYNVVKDGDIYKNGLSFRIHNFKGEGVIYHRLSDRTYDLVFDDRSGFWYLDILRKEGEYTFIGIEDKVSPILYAAMMLAVRDIHHPLSNPILLALFAEIHRKFNTLNRLDYYADIADWIRRIYLSNV